MSGKMKKFLIRLFCLVWVVTFCFNCTAMVLLADEDCPHCGDDVPEGLVICPHCWVCVKCGAQNNENATVCENCGAQNSSGGGTSGGDVSDDPGSSSNEPSNENSSSPNDGTNEEPATTEVPPIVMPEDVGDFTPMGIRTISIGDFFGAPAFFCWPEDLPLPLNVNEYWAGEYYNPWLQQQIVEDSYSWMYLHTASGYPVYEFRTSVLYQPTSQSWDTLDSTIELFSSTPGWKFVEENTYHHDAIDEDNPPEEHHRYDFETERMVAGINTKSGKVIYLPACSVTIKVYADIKNGQYVNYQCWMQCSCPIAQGAFPAVDILNPLDGTQSPPSDSDGNRVIQLEDGTYVTIDDSGEINTDPFYSGITQDDDGTYTNQNGSLPVPDYRDYEVGDIVIVGGVSFILMLVAGVPTWVGPGGIGLDGKSLIPEDKPKEVPPTDDGEKPKEPQKEVTPDDDGGDEPKGDDWQTTAGYITEAMKGTPIVTEIMDLLLIMGEKGVNVGKLAGPLASAGFEFIDFTAQGSDAVTAGIKTLISAGMKMAAGAGATFTDAGLNAMKYEFCEFAKQFEQYTGIDTSGIRDMASRLTSTVSPGENIKNTASVMVDFVQEGYKCLISKESNQFTTGLLEDYRAGKYGENIKNMQLATDMITDYFNGKPVLEEIQTGLGQMLKETNQSITDYISKSILNSK